MFSQFSNSYDIAIVYFNKESFPDTIGLPNCVKLWNSVVTAEQKHRDSQLPKLLHDLDEACKHGANDVHKGRLASFILHAASSPLRKYRILHFFELLDHNKVILVLFFLFFYGQS